MARGVHQGRQSLLFRNHPDFPKLYMPFDSLLLFAGAGKEDRLAFAVLAGKARMGNVYVWDHEDDSRGCSRRR